MSKDELSPAGTNALDLAKIFQSKIPDPQEIGVTGSILVGLDSPDSDYDIVVYGRHNCLTLHNCMDFLFDSSGELIRYSEEDMPARYDFRAAGSGIPLEVFSFHESRKTHQGRFRGVDFFLRYVPFAEESGLNFALADYFPLGQLTVTGVVQDAQNAIFTPCTYGVEITTIEKSSVKVPNAHTITEIFSLRGRFCEQLIDGEKFRCQGILERVNIAGEIHYRIILGNQKTDYLTKM